MCFPFAEKCANQLSQCVSFLLACCFPAAFSLVKYSPAFYLLFMMVSTPLSSVMETLRGFSRSQLKTPGIVLQVIGKQKHLVAH